MKKESSLIIGLIAAGLARANMENSLKTFGDRKMYVGSSDIIQCPYKAVAAKLFGEDHDLKTLIRFRRGDMSESIIEDAYRDIEARFPGYTVLRQHKVSHPDYPYMQAHIDFLIYNDTHAKIIECKSCNGIPDKPRKEWEIQLNWQIGLALADIFNGKKIKLTGSVLAFDLNAGDVAEFGDFIPNERLFAESMATADSVMKAVEAGDPSMVDCVPSGLCLSHCSFKQSCPNFMEKGKHAKLGFAAEAVTM